MSVALIGLLLLQFYWLRNVHELHAEQFKTDVNLAVESAISDLEKLENNITFSKQNNKFNVSHNSFNHLFNLKENLTIKDTIIKSNNKKLDYLVISGVTIDSLSGASAEHRVITQNRQQFTNVEISETRFNPKDSSFSFPIKFGQNFEQGLMIKSKKLNELMLKMFTTNIYDDITLRLNPKILDTLIRYKLKLSKIDTLFNFRVLNSKNELTKFASAPINYQLNIENPEFKFKLYPTDLVSNSYFVELDFPNKKSFMFKSMLGTLIAALLLVLIVMFAFYFAVSTIFKQKKVSEIKNDFISNMTHELKTPISTISLACEAIEDPDMKKNPELMNGFIDMIASENKRLGNLVEKVLQTSLLEKGKLNLQLATYQINQIVLDTVKAFEIQFKQKGGELQLKRNDDVLHEVDKIHFSNVIFNLLDNALKYSGTNPITKVELIKENKGFSVKIIDNGIGIKKEDQKRIFDKLYRVSTGNVHDVKGFGLGLDYVNRIVEMHGGIIRVKSEYGKGSTFKITIKNE